MRIVLATPLYPPDISDPAPYTYELAKRLATKHTVLVVTYGHHPEELPGVAVHKVDKRLPTYRRALQFRLALLEVLKDADVLFIQSGISAELPALFASHSARVWWRESAEPKNPSLLRRLVRVLTLRNAVSVPLNNALVRPEIFPLEPRPEAELAAWETAWQAHIELLETL